MGVAEKTGIPVGQRSARIFTWYKQPVAARPSFGYMVKDALHQGRNWESTPSISRTLADNSQFETDPVLEDAKFKTFREWY